MGTFVISKRFSGDYKFEFTSRKGKTIFTSNSYELRFECENEIGYLKESLENSTFMKFKTSSGKFFFKLIVGERELAVSRKYSTLLMLEKGIAEIHKYAVKSEVLDFASNDFVFPDIQFQE